MLLRDRAYLQVESSSRFGHLAQEVFMETRAQDVLSVSLIGVKGQFLLITSHISHIHTG